MSSKKSIIPIARVEESILVIRGQKVMLDRDLAVLYGVETRALNQAVKRNRDRFPDDFMFELTRDEIETRDGVRGGEGQARQTPEVERQSVHVGAVAARRGIRREGLRVIVCP